jgi:hypothetical protein
MFTRDYHTLQLFLGIQTSNYPESPSLINLATHTTTKKGKKKAGEIGLLKIWTTPVTKPSRFV